MQARAVYKVVVNGVDYTSRFDPVMKSITVNDADGVKSDTAQISVADPNGQTYLPEPDAKVEIFLGHEGKGVGVVFRGKVDSVSCRGTKGGGREMNISAKGLDTKSKAKEPREVHRDNATFGDVAEQWAQDAEMGGVRIDPDLRAIRRDYWSMENESFVHWGDRIAREIGATFRVSDNVAIFVKRNASQTSSGQDLPAIVAKWGQNLISYDVNPYDGRPQFSRTRARWYDREQARFREEDVTIDQQTPAEQRRRITSGSQSAARQNAGSDGQESERRKGGGSVTLLGDPQARVESPLRIEDCRPGVDGEYKITSLTHNFSKDGGYTTRVQFGKPGKDAGTDGRRRSRRGRSSPQEFSE